MPSKSELREKWNNVGENVVVFHTIQRGKFCPNVSPFSMKFETYLKMAGIDYEIDNEQPLSSKNKMPWMTFNKENMSDSQLCMEHLAEKLDKDLSKDLTKEQQAISRSLRIMAEDHLYWTLVYYYWGLQKGKYVKSRMDGSLPVPKFLEGFAFGRIVKTISAQAKAQGIGRHTKDEVVKMGIQDLQALSDYLGDKPFFMGNEPTEIDCTIFGFETFIINGDPKGEDDNPFLKAIEADMGNLKEHCIRMKEKYWSDWNDNLYKTPVKPEKTKKESKKEAKETEEKKEEEDKPKEEPEGAKAES